MLDLGFTKNTCFSGCRVWATRTTLLTNRPAAATPLSESNAEFEGLRMPGLQQAWVLKISLRRVSVSSVTRQCVVAKRTKQFKSGRRKVLATEHHPRVSSRKLFGGDEVDGVRLGHVEALKAGALQETLEASGHTRSHPRPARVRYKPWCVEVCGIQITHPVHAWCSSCGRGSFSMGRLRQREPQRVAWAPLDVME